MAKKQVVIVGGSLAGVTAALSLHDAGFLGEISLIEAGESLPPDRPALSKQVVTGAGEPALHRGAERLLESDVSIMVNTRAVSFEATTRRLEVEDSAGARSTLTPDYVVFATGSIARSLPPHMMDGLTPGSGRVFVVREAADAIGLRAALGETTGRVVIVGAGFIGAEVAASIRSLGRDVTMIEAAPQPLDRVLPSSLGVTIADLHRSHGVDVRVGVGIGSLVAHGESPNRHVVGVTLQTGELLACDVVVLGVGAGPDLDWLRGSGLDGFGSQSNSEEAPERLPNGLQANEFCEIAENVFAVGDVLSWPHPRFDQRVRIEQWENAINSGAYVGKRIAVLADSDHTTTQVSEPYDELPWFWSDQYDRKLQMVGLPERDDEVYIVDGALEDFRFVALLKRGENCSGVMAMNRPRHIVMARQQLNKSMNWVALCDALGVADPTVLTTPTTQKGTD